MAALEEFWPLLVIGLVIGSIYAIAAAGLVLTYRTSGVFNFAHGAVGMFAAFTFSWLVQRVGLPVGPAILVTVLFVAPAIGVLLDRIVFRRLRDAPIVVTIVVTIGLLVALQGLASAIFGRAGLSPQQIFPSRVFVFGRLAVGADQIGVVGVAGIVSGALWVLLRRTRAGVTMRAVVDRPGLADLMGISSNLVASASWALGSMLAALAGILITPQVSLEVFTLTLLVINAYAAAMVGRLESLPLTFAGAVGLGLAETVAVRYLPTNVSNSVRPSLSFVLLFALLLVPRRKKSLREPREVAPAARPPTTGARRPLVVRLAILAIMTVVAVSLLGRLGAGALFTFDLAIAHAIIFLSLVVLVGYGGQISLAQASLAGVGGVVTAHLVGGAGVSWLLAVPLAGLAAVPIGVLLAYPAVRLHGLFLGLATMAFGLLMDHAFFARASVAGGTSGIRVARPAGFGSDRAMAIVLMLLFGILALAVHNLRGSRTGRILAAMRDSERGARSIGISMARYKMAVFALSAFVAGVGGAAYVAVFERVSSDQFTMFYSLVWLAVAVIGGISSWSGALVGGLVYQFVPYLVGQVHGEGIGVALNDLVPVAFGLGAIGLARNPHGISTLPGRVLQAVAARAREAVGRLEAESIEEGSVAAE